MFDLPLHPAIVHLPLGVAFAVPLLAIAVAAGRALGKLPPLSGWLLVLAQLLVVGGGVVALETGEEEEERVEERLGHDAIHEHEEKAEGFVVAAGVLAGVFVLGAALPWRKAALGLTVVGALGSLPVAGMGVAVGHAGGELVHGEKGLAGTAAMPLDHDGEHDDDDDERDEDHD